MPSPLSGILSSWHHYRHPWTLSENKHETALKTSAERSAAYEPPIVADEDSIMEAAFLSEGSSAGGIELSTNDKVRSIAWAVFAGICALPLLIVGGLAVGYTVFVISTARRKERMLKRMMNIPPTELSSRAGDNPIQERVEKSPSNARSQPTPDDSFGGKTEAENKRAEEKKEGERPKEHSSKVADQNSSCDGDPTPEPTTPRFSEAAFSEREIFFDRKINEQDYETLAVNQKLFEIELEVPDDDVPLCAISGPIAVGFSNPTRTTCWLNSVLAYIGATHWGDIFCSAEITADNEETREEHQNIQRLLRKIVISLRTGERGAIVSNKLVLEFIESIKVLLPTLVLPTADNYLEPVYSERRQEGDPEQQDAAEIFLALQAIFPSRAKEIHYHSQEIVRRNAPRSPCIESKILPESPVLVVVCNSTNKRELNFNDLKSSKTTRYRDNLDLSADAVQIECIQETLLTKAPDSLVVLISRGEQQNDIDEAVKSSAPIEFCSYKNDPFTMTLYEYEEAAEGVAPTVLFKCHYSITGAIIHSGERLQAGHYIFAERNDSSFYFHNDNMVSYTSQEDAHHELKQAVLLQLQLICKNKARVRPKKVRALPPPNYKPVVAKKRAKGAGREAAGSDCRIKQ